MSSKPVDESRFSVLSQENVELHAETIGITGLDDNLLKSLAEDATYRLREVVQVAQQYMKHAKRRRLTTEDLSRAMQLNSIEAVYGYGSGEDMQFRNTTTKNGEMFFVDDKEICIRELALGTAVPTDPGKVTVNAQWLSLEGVYLPGNSNSGPGRKPVNENGGQHKPLSEISLGYFEQITKAILGENEKCRKVALDDLSSNPKISCLLAYFVNYVASGVKTHCNDLKQLSRLLRLVESLMDNPTLFVEPYVIQLVTAVMYCLLETLTVSLNPTNEHWHLRDHAARILAHISRKCSNPVNYLRQQLLMTLQEVLLDDGRPYCSHYGAVVGLTELGAEALEQFLLPHLNNYYEQLLQVLEDSSIANAVLQGEAIQVYGALLQAAGCLLKSKSQIAVSTFSFPVNNNSHSMLRVNLSPWPGSNVECRPAPVSATRSRSSSVNYTLPNQAYKQLYGVFGDSLSPYVGFNNWQENSSTRNNQMRIQPLAHSYFPLRPLQRDIVVIRQLIGNAKEKVAGRALSIPVPLSTSRKRSHADDDGINQPAKKEKRGKYHALVLKSPTKIPTALVTAGVFEFPSPTKKGAEHHGGKKKGRSSKKKGVALEAQAKQGEKVKSERRKMGQPKTGSIKKMFHRARASLTNKIKYDYHLGITL